MKCNSKPLQNILIEKNKHRKQIFREIFIYLSRDNY